jgi:hypothetical protein
LLGNNHFNQIRRLFSIQPYTTFEHSSLANITSSTRISAGDPDVTGYVYGAGIAGTSDDKYIV